jgi:hypothetical protein
MKSPLRGSYDMMKLLCPFCLEPFERAYHRHATPGAGGDLYVTEHIEHCDGRPGSWVPGASTWNQPYYAAQASVGYGLMAATSMLMGGFAPSPIFGAKPSYGATPPGSQNDPIKETLTPDLIEPIIGWRFWRVDKLGRLMSMNGGKNASIAPRWAGREPLVAECNVGADKHPQHGISPSENCTCGIYSSNTLETLFDYIEDLESAATLFGRTRNWGKVIRHQTGIRSQYSYPESIYAVGVPDTDRADQLSIVEQRYGIPVTILARKGDAYRLAVEEHLDAKTTDPKLTWLKKEDDGTYPNDPRSNA